MEKIHYEHIIINSGVLSDTETKINAYIENLKMFGEVEIISLNVIPEQVKTVIIDGYGIPMYHYHISLVYKFIINN